jgi:hypothetical protein
MNSRRLGVWEAGRGAAGRSGNRGAAGVAKPPATGKPRCRRVASVDTIAIRMESVSPPASLPVAGRCWQLRNAPGSRRREGGIHLRSAHPTKHDNPRPVSVLGPARSGVHPALGVTLETSEVPNSTHCDLRHYAGEYENVLAEAWYETRSTAALESS